MTDVPPNERPTNMVFQSYAIFPHLNVADNVGYGLKKQKLPKEEIDRRVDDALKLVDLEGYGPRESHALSGGQRQRLAIARALIAEPAFLLLDEATSALDAESEQSIRKSVEALKGEMTILVIAHRLSTVRQADRILVFEEGELIASGTHAELVKDSELYARFADIQFSS